jgi:hypothetical protein
MKRGPLPRLCDGIGPLAAPPAPGGEIARLGAGRPDDRDENDGEAGAGVVTGMEGRSIHPRPVPLKPSARQPSRRQMLGAAVTMTAGSWALWAGARPASAIGDHARLRFARLHLPDLPNPRPTALRRLAFEIERRTSLITVPEAIDIRATDPELFRYPFLLLSGDRGFAPPPDADVARLRRFLTYGGFLLIDSSEGRASGRFDESVRGLLSRTLPGDLPGRVNDDHVLWKSFYLLHGPSGRIMAAPYIEGVERDRRLAVIYTQNDLLGALARDGFGRWEHEVIPGGETQREMAFRLAVNIVMYAFCLDYKSEQAHIDYILRTRRQR